MSVADQEAVATRLGDVVTQVRVRSSPADLPQDEHFVGLEDIAQDGGPIVGSSRVSDVRSTVHGFQADDVLYGRLRPYLRKVAVAQFDGHASAEIIVLRCSDYILPGYLRMVLLSDGFGSFIGDTVKGDRPRTSFTSLSEFVVVLPPLEVQAELVRREELLAQAIVQINEAVLQHESAVACLTSSVRTQVVWQWNEEAESVPLADLLESIQYGTPEKSTLDPGGIPVLRIPNVSSSGSIDVSDLKYAATPTLDEKYQVKAGDLLLVRSNGSLSLVGQVALVAEEHDGFGFAGYLLRLRPRDGVLSDYVLELVRSAPFRIMVEGAARSTSGVNNLSATRLAAFRVPLPPIDRQQAAVDVMARLRESTALAAHKLADTCASALSLQEAARSYWLGQTRRGANPAKPLPQALPAKVKTGEDEHTMRQDIETVILERFQRLGDEAASFEVLMEGVRADYDTMRDAVLKLLSESPPRLTQKFDRSTKSIMLRRTS